MKMWNDKKSEYHFGQLVSCSCCCCYQVKVHQSIWFKGVTGWREEWPE